MAKMRSPNYPAVSLRDSIQRAKSLWTKEKRTAVPAEVAAKAIGYSGLSGPSRTALAAMKKYGLVDSDDDTVRVSDLYLRLSHAANDGDELKALQEAALKPELFSQLYESHVDASDDAIRSYLIVKLGFSESGAKQVIKAFRDTISLALLDQPEYITTRNSAQEDGVQVQDNKARTTLSGPDFEASNSARGGLSGKTTTSQTITVLLGPSVFAEVKIVGDDFKPEYVDALRQYLAITQKLAQPLPKSTDSAEESDPRSLG